MIFSSSATSDIKIGTSLPQLINNIGFHRLFKCLFIETVHLPKCLPCLSALKQAEHGFFFSPLLSCNSAVFRRQNGLKPGMKMVVTEADGKIVLTPQSGDPVDKL